MAQSPHLTHVAHELPRAQLKLAEMTNPTNTLTSALQQSSVLFQFNILHICCSSALLSFRTSKSSVTPATELPQSSSGHCRQKKCPSETIHERLQI